VVEQLINRVMRGGKVLDQAQNILLKCARMQRQPSLHQSLRAVVGADVWPAGECEPASECPGEGHGFDTAAFLRTQFESVDIVIESVRLNLPVSEPYGKEYSLSHAVVAPMALLKF